MSIILASASEIRKQLLEQAGVPVRIVPARVDEDAVKSALLAEAATPRDVCDALAELKARKISEKHHSDLVLGCDQVLDHRGVLMSKPKSVEDARAQLRVLRGDRHTLLSAVVICEAGQPLWRHVGTVRLRMHEFSDAYLEEYLTRNWSSVQHSVGAYKLEEEGVRLFSRIDGDYFTILGLPLLELLAHLRLRGEIAA